RAVSAPLRRVAALGVASLSDHPRDRMGVTPGAVLQAVPVREHAHHRRSPAECHRPAESPPGRTGAGSARAGGPGAGDPPRRADLAGGEDPRPGPAKRSAAGRKPGAAEGASLSVAEGVL